MRRLLAAILSSVTLAAGVAAQPYTSGAFTVVTGGQTYPFTATGEVNTLDDDGRPRAIQMSADHPDGTTLMLWFTETRGRASDLMFRFREPDTADIYGREWSEARGFAVTLTEVRRQGDTLIVTGSYGGEIVDKANPSLRGRINGTFTVTLVEPILSPN